MRVLLIGGTGFTGRCVARELVARGHELRCLVRPGSDRSPLVELGARPVPGDLGEPGSLPDALRGADAMVCAASLGFGHAPGLVGACGSAGVSRAVFFSTTAIFTRLPAASRQVRLAAEDAIRDSALEYTILRPTMIYGAPGDRNLERLLRAAARWPALPVVGRGDRLVQPVFVDDLAAAAAAALSKRAVRRCYELPGKEAVSFRGLVEAAGRAVGRPVRILPVPAALAIGAARLLQAVWPRAPIRSEQVLRLLEDKDFRFERAARDLGFRPRGVAEGLRIEAERLGLGGAA